MQKKHRGPRRSSLCPVNAHWSDGCSVSRRSRICQASHVFKVGCGFSVCSYQTLKSYYDTGIRSAFLRVQIFVELLTRPGDGSPLQYSCLANPMDGGAWWAAVHGVAKSQTRLSDLPFTFHFHALEKEMATHSSVLAWRIPGTGEPGGLLSMGSHRVGYN